MPSWQTLQNQFWRSISRQGFAWFLLAIATTFGSMGCLLDLTSLDAPFSTALYNAVFSALLAIGSFVSITYYPRFFPLVIALHLGGIWFLRGPGRQPPFAAFADIPLERRLTLDIRRCC